MEVQHFLDNYELDVTSQNGFNMVITADELQIAYNKQKLGKAWGFDGLPAECIQSSGVKKYLLKLFNACY